MGWEFSICVRHGSIEHHDVTANAGCAQGQRWRFHASRRGAGSGKKSILRSLGNVNMTKRFLENIVHDARRTSSQTRLLPLPSGDGTRFAKIRFV